MTAAERPLRADARRNHDKLVAVAREVFMEHGPEAPLDEIARRAAVGPGTLYRHFPTRDALVAAVYRDDVECIATRADELAAQLPPFEALAAWLGEQVAYAAHKHGLGGALKTMLANDSVTLDYCRDTIGVAIRKLLDRARDAGEVRDDIDPSMLLRLVHGIGVASEREPASASPMLAIVLDGIRPATKSAATDSVAS